MPRGMGSPPTPGGIVLGTAASGYGRCSSSAGRQRCSPLGARDRCHVVLAPSGGATAHSYRTGRIDQLRPRADRDVARPGWRSSVGRREYVAAGGARLLGIGRLQSSRRRRSGPRVAPGGRQASSAGGAARERKRPGRKHSESGRRAERRGGHGRGLFERNGTTRSRRRQRRLSRNVNSGPPRNLQDRHAAYDSPRSQVPGREASRLTSRDWSNAALGPCSPWPVTSR